jgi:hypothetical protein
MMKSRTRNTRNRHRPHVLEVRVMSPRIAWFSFLKVAGKLTKYACLFAALVGIGWGIWQGIHRAFYKNPDFRLQVIDLNPNPVIDEVRLAEAAGIDLTASIFDIDVDIVTTKLKAMPEIADANVERHLPGKLVVRVIARGPRAWVACKEAGLSEGRLAGAMLVDRGGIAYPCPELQLEDALKLPVIHLPLSEKNSIKPGQKVNQPELAHCFRLLDAACASDPAAIHWIDSVKQVNEWSLLLVTRDGTAATFGLGDHERQIRGLRAAMDHAAEKGYSINTINLIPKHNIPITLHDEVAAPRAIPVSEPNPKEIRKERHARDLNTLLNRN